MNVVICQNPHLQTATFACFYNAFCLKRGDGFAEWGSAESKLFAKFGFGEAGARGHVASGDGGYLHMAYMTSCRQFFTMHLLDRQTVARPIN